MRERGKESRVVAQRDVAAKHGGILSHCSLALSMTRTRASSYGVTGKGGSLLPMCNGCIASHYATRLSAGAIQTRTRGREASKLANKATSTSSPQDAHIAFKQYWKHSEQRHRARLKSHSHHLRLPQNATSARQAKRPVESFFRCRADREQREKTSKWTSPGLGH